MTATTATSYVVQQRVKGAERWLDLRSCDDIIQARVAKRTVDEFHQQPAHKVPMELESRVIERRVTTVEEVMP